MAATKQKRASGQGQDTVSKGTLPRAHSSARHHPCSVCHLQTVLSDFESPVDEPTDEVRGLGIQGVQSLPQILTSAHGCAGDKTLNKGAFGRHSRAKPQHTYIYTWFAHCSPPSQLSLARVMLWGRCVKCQCVPGVVWVPALQASDSTWGQACLSAGWGRALPLPWAGSSGGHTLPFPCLSGVLSCQDFFQMSPISYFHILHMNHPLAEQS